MRLVWLMLTLVLFWLGGGARTSGRSAEAAQSFPLSPGTYWVYGGLLRSGVEGSSVGRVTHVRWKMSVVRLLEREGLIAAVVRGFPGDLNWSDGNVDPQLSILLERPDGKFYLIPTVDDPSILDQLDSPNYPWEDLTREQDCFLELPLAAGARFGCDRGAEKTEDGEYCWVVGPPHPAVLADVKGIAPGSRVSYELDYLTNAEDTELEFAPGIGITGYSYHHHGAIAETELHLVEFHTAD
jgi:hypothetical protein